MTLSQADIDSLLGSQPADDVGSLLDKPASGEDIATALQDPTFTPTVDQYKLFEDYNKTKQTDWLQTILSAADTITQTAGQAAKAAVTTGAALNPKNYLEGLAQGTTQLYGLVAQSQNPDSALFKLNNLIGGTGSVESRYDQFIAARQFNKDLDAYAKGDMTIMFPPEQLNPEFVQGVAMVADPTMFLPGIGQLLGVEKVGAKAVGKAAQLAGKGVQAVARPVEMAAGAAERAITGITGVSPEALRGGLATSGVLAATGAAPAVGLIGAVPLAAAGAMDLGRALESAGTQLGRAPTRIGALEAVGAIPEANLRQRVIGTIGRYGGDAALNSALVGTTGSIEGATIGGVLGYLSGGEEGAAAGIGSGGVSGALGSLGARGLQSLTGAQARAARLNDLTTYVDTLPQNKRAAYQSVQERFGTDVASNLMDLETAIRGTRGDIGIELLKQDEFQKQAGVTARGIVPQENAPTPRILINVDAFSRGKGDTPIYTLGHELVHALGVTKQFQGDVTALTERLTGAYIPNPDGTMRLTTEGEYTPAKVEELFNQFVAKLPNEVKAKTITDNPTPADRAAYVGEELVAEQVGRILSAQKPDAFLRGFGTTRQSFTDMLMLQDASRAASRIGQYFERTFGVTPSDSILFPQIKESSPILDASLRQLLRARANINEALQRADFQKSFAINSKNINDPTVAEYAIRGGFATRDADGTVRLLTNGELLDREQRDVRQVKAIVDNLPGARFDIDGNLVGQLSKEQADALNASSVSSQMKERIAAVNQAINEGRSILNEYYPATEKKQDPQSRRWRTRYAGRRMTFRETLFYNLLFSKEGNAYARGIDLTKIRSSLQKHVRDGGVAGLWPDVGAFMGDLAAYLTNRERGENAIPTRQLLGPDKAQFMGDFLNSFEKGGSEFIHAFRLDRFGKMDPGDFRARFGETGYRGMKDRLMPAGNVGDAEAFKSQSGYTVLSKNNKFRLYGPDGTLLGIYDSSQKAEKKLYATQARIQPQERQLQRQQGNEVGQTPEAGGRNRAIGRQEGQGQGGPVRQAGDVGARFMAASEADPTQPSTQAIRTAKAERAVNSLYQFDYTYKVQRQGKPSKEVTATETVAAFSFTEARDKAKKAIQKELEDKAGVLRSTVSIGQPTIKGQFAVTQLTGKNRDKTVPKIVLNPKNSQQFKSMFDAVDAALELVKYSPTLGLDSDGWIRAFSRAMNGSKASIPPAPLRLAEWVKSNDSFKTFIMDGLQRNPDLVKSAVGGLNALQPIHEMARKGMIHPKMVALHMFWGLLSRMLDPYNQEAGWARLTSDPKVNRLLEESVAGQYKSSKEEWKAIVDAKMSEFPDVKIGRNAIQNANAFHEMLSRWNGRWNELTDIINNPTLDGPQMRRKFNQQGFGGAGIKHKVLSFVLATLARNDVFVGDRWQVVNLWFPHLEKAVAARKSAGGSGDVFAYDKNGVPEDTTGAYKVIGGMLNNETVAETSYSLIENAMKKIAADSPWLREILGREAKPFDIHWLTWNIIKNEPVGHSSLDATAKFLTENLYGDPEFAKKFAETEKRTEKYTKGGFDVFSVKGQERPQLSKRPGANYGGTVPADLRTYAGGSPGGLEGPSAARPGSERYFPAESSQEDTGRRVPSSRFGVDPATRGTDFADAIRRTKVEHPFGFAVDDKGSEFYSSPSTQLFLSDDGLAGVAVTDYGDLVSVFKHPASKADIKPLLAEAAERSQTLDAFDVNGFLPNLYGNFGFRPVARVPFNREFAPPGWRYDLAGEPDVVLMVKDTSGASGAPQITGKNYSEIKAKVPSVDYDTAVKLQQDAKQRIADASKQPQAEVGAQRYMPSLTPDASMPGAYSMSGYRVLPGRERSKLRIYSPSGSLLGIASSTDEAQRMIQRKSR